VRERRPEVGQQRRIGACAPDVAEVERGDQERLFPLRTANAQVAVRPQQRRAAGKDLAPLAPHQVGEGDEDAMLLGDLANQSFPAGDRRRPGVAVVARMDTARRCS
jgi:hypothetical protein